MSKSDLDGVLSDEEFCSRFVARIMERCAPRTTFDDGTSIEAYARDAAPGYLDDTHMRAEGPEDCADADMSYWGEE